MGGYCHVPVNGSLNSFCLVKIDSGCLKVNHFLSTPCWGDLLLHDIAGTVKVGVFLTRPDVRNHAVNDIACNLRKPVRAPTAGGHASQCGNQSTIHFYVSQATACLKMSHEGCGTVCNALNQSELDVRMCG